MQSWTSTERWFLRDVIAPLVTWNTDFRTLPEKRKLFPPTQPRIFPPAARLDSHFSPIGRLHAARKRTRPLDSSPAQDGQRVKANP